MSTAVTTASRPGLLRLLDAGMSGEFIPAERACMCSVVSRKFSESIGSNKSQPTTLIVHGAHGSGDDNPAEEAQRARRYADVTARYMDHSRLFVDAFRSPKGLMLLMHKTAWTYAAAGVRSVQLVDIRLTQREGLELTRAMQQLANVESIRLVDLCICGAVHERAVNMFSASSKLRELWIERSPSFGYRNGVAAIADAVARAQGLRVLLLARNGLDKEQVEQILAGLSDDSALETLHVSELLRYRRNLPHDTMRLDTVLPRLKHLRSVLLERNSYYERATWPYPPASQSGQALLQGLTGGAPPVDMHAHRPFPPTLETLHMGRLSITRHAAIALVAGLKSYQPGTAPIMLRSLSFDECNMPPIATAGIVRSIANSALCSSLTALKLDGNQASTDTAVLAVAAVVVACRNLESLSIENMDLGRGVAGGPRDVYGSPASVALATAFSHAARLNTLNISNNGLDAVTTCMVCAMMQEGVAPLRALYAGGNVLGAVRCGQAMEHLAKIPTLEYIDMRDAGVESGSGITAALTVAGGFPALQVLNLSGNSLPKPDLERMKNAMRMRTPPYVATVFVTVAGSTETKDLLRMRFTQRQKKAKPQAGAEAAGNT